MFYFTCNHGLTADHPRREMFTRSSILAVALGVLGVIGAVVETTFEQLDGDHSEDEVKQHVDDHDVENVLQRVDDTVEHSLSAAETHA